MNRLLVRCCCQPTKILGSLPYDDGSKELRVPVAGARGFDHIVFPVATMTTLCDMPMLGRLDRDFTKQIEIEQLIEAQRYRELAYKSEDTPIETLRRIRDFIEAPADLNRFDYVCPYCFGDLRTCPCGEKKS